MGVYIKDMEMPKNCSGCFLRVGKCSRRIYMENRPLDCPLIEVIEPHGRLIDADALLEEFDGKYKYVALIKKAPTVIEEEGE